MIINKTLELPMNSVMGRIRLHHALYVQCWLGVDKHLKNWLGEEGCLDSTLLDEVLTKNPTVEVDAPEECVWKVQGDLGKVKR